MESFEGKVAVVTGAASGIGLALSQKFASVGMAVVMADIERDALGRAAESVAAAGVDTLAVPTDVSSADAVEALAVAAYERFGDVHVLCNNAGVAATAAALGIWAWEGTLHDWSWTMNVNLMGVVHGLRSFVPRMLDRDTEGHIVNTASSAGLLPGSNPYSVSKHAVLGLTEGLRNDLRQAGAEIGASVLCPGLVNTSILDAERNRPSDLGSTNVSGFRPEVQAFAEFFDASVRGGFEPSEIAEATFDAIVHDRLYVVPVQDYIADLIDTRLKAQLARENPPLPAT